MSIRISNAVATEIADTLSTLLKSAVVIQVYPGDLPEADLEDVSSNGALVSIPLNLMFGPPESVEGGVKVSLGGPLDPENATASGTARWFGLLNSDGEFLIVGTVSLVGQGGNMELSSTTLTEGEAVQVISLSVTIPKG